jgi:hypothetical protein
LPAKLVNHLRLNLPKPRLALALKKLTYRATETRFNRMVGIDERKLQAPGKLAAHGGFTGAWEAYEGDQYESLYNQ